MSLYLYKFAQNCDLPYRTYKARPIVFIQIGSKLRSAVSAIQGPTHCIHINWLKNTIRRIVNTRPASLYWYTFTKNYDPPYRPYKTDAIVFIQVGLKLRFAISSIQCRRNCIRTKLLKITIRRIIHTRPVQLYSYKLAQKYDPHDRTYNAAPLYSYILAPNYGPPYRPYKARPILFIQICSKLRSAVSYIQCRRNCIHTDWLKITIRRIDYTRQAPLYL